MELNKALCHVLSHGFEKEDNKVYVKCRSIEDASDILDRCFKWHFEKSGEEYKRLRCHRDIAEWLTDNKGKGLFLFGHCGQGKTLLARFILPAILYYYMNPKKIVSYYRMVDANRIVDEVVSKHLIALDDVGTEEPFVEYGFKRNSFSEIMDAVEQKDKLIIITTNLSKEEIEERYGTRTVERIIATCKPVCFTACKLESICYRFKENGGSKCADCEKFEPLSFRG